MEVLSNKWQVIYKKEVLALLIATTAFFLINIVKQPLAFEAQALYIPETTAFIPLLCLPHGIRIIMTWYFGWRAIIYLFFASLLTISLTIGQQSLTPLLLLFCLMTAAIPYITFYLFNLGGWDLYKLKNIKPKKRWHALVLVGIVSALLNAFVIHVILSGHIMPDKAVDTILFYIITDTACAISFMAACAYINIKSTA